jgi:hypothetical protein
MKKPSSNYVQLHEMTSETIQKLNDMEVKYDRLMNNASPEADAQVANMKDLVERYKTYKEVTRMMSKLRTMWFSEASDKRKAKIEKSFIELFRGKAQVEETLKEKLGLPYIKTTPTIPEIDQLERIDKEISDLSAAYESKKLTLPSGKSTREQRFLS